MMKKKVVRAQSKVDSDSFFKKRKEEILIQLTVAKALKCSISKTCRNSLLNIENEESRMDKIREEGSIPD